jgi:hypothetical protein
MVPWLMALAQIILFFRNVKIFKKYLFQREYFVKIKEEYYRDGIRFLGTLAWTSYLM